jgi:hypothetical protein
VTGAEQLTAVIVVAVCLMFTGVAWATAWGQKRSDHRIDLEK